MAIYIDDVKYSVNDALKKLMINPNTIPYRKNLKEFVQKMDRDAQGKPKRDGDGNYAVRRKIHGAPEFSVFVKDLGYNVRVRLADSQRKIKDGEWDYTPKMVSMEPGEDGSIQVNDQNTFTFWYLHPWNLQSPFRSKESPWFYEYKDDELLNKTANSYEEDRVDAMSLIVGRHSRPMRELKTIAKGLNVQNVDEMSDESVRAKLREIANENPREFINKVDSREIIFDGYLQDAQDKGILELKSLNSMQRWYLNNREIVPVAFGTDAQATLREEIAKNAHLYLQEITDSLANKDVADGLNSPVLDQYFQSAQTDRAENDAEVDDEVFELEKKFKLDDIFAKKIAGLASLDPNQPGLHHNIKKSIAANQKAIDVYRKSQSLQAEVPVV